MNFVKGKRRRLILALVALAVVAGAVLLYVFVFNRPPGTTEYLTGALNDKTTKEDLANGNCSSDTSRNFSIIDENGDARIVAKAYETRGLCLVYANDKNGAKEAYYKAAAFYEKAGDPEQAAVLKGIADRITSSLEPDNNPESQPEEPLPDEVTQQ